MLNLIASFLIAVSLIRSTFDKVKKCVKTL